MPALDRRRRRRPIGPILVALVLVGVALFLLIGGALEVGHASGPYWSDVDRSYSAQGAVLVDQSNQTGATLDKLVVDMASMTRRPLQEQLDSLVAATAGQAGSAAALSPPSPANGLDQGFAGVMATRALAVDRLRSAVDGLLGMAPLPVRGAVPSATGTASPAARAGGATVVLLPTAKVTSDLAQVGALLDRSDQSYATVRRGFLAAPGSAALPRSVWVHDPQLWSPGPVQTLVDNLTGSKSLTPVHRLQLLTVRLNPSPVPPIGTPSASSASSAAAGTATAGAVSSVIPPTTRLRVEAIVGNYGNVGEAKVVVTAQTEPQGGGSASSASATIALQPGSTAAVALPALAVDPGATYGLTVTVAAPAAQSNRSGLSGDYTVQVAPASPTTTPTS
jgi:hypothetical protein